MQTWIMVLGAGLLLAGLGALVQLSRRRGWRVRRPARHAVVSTAELRAAVFYPYVFVEEDGSVRELTTEERRHLQTPYERRDPQRPHVKSCWDARNPRGGLGGYCSRRLLPPRKPVGYPPIPDFVPPAVQRLDARSSRARRAPDTWRGSEAKINP